MTFALTGYGDAQLIGEGGLGRVYRATRESTGGLVAIKELRDVASVSPAWHRARRELDAMLRLKGHAAVVSVEEVVAGPNGPCIVMEYVGGGSLADRVDAGPLPLPEIVLIGAEVVDALGAAHDAGVVHRDIKPHNILVTTFGHVKVCDFGIAALARDAGGRTQTNALTLAYASPEELDGADIVGPPADVYSLSATLQHLLTGRKPRFDDRLTTGVPGWAAQAADDDVARFVVGALLAAQSRDPAARPTTRQLAATFDRAAVDLGRRRISRLDPIAAAGATVVRRPAATISRPLPARVTSFASAPVAPSAVPLPPPPIGPPPTTRAGTEPPPPPTVVHPTVQPDGHVPPPPSRRHRGRWMALAGALLVLVVAGVVALTMRRGDRDDGAATATTSRVATADDQAGTAGDDTVAGDEPSGRVVVTSAATTVAAPSTTAPAAPATTAVAAEPATTAAPVTTSAIPTLPPTTATIPPPPPTPAATVDPQLAATQQLATLVDTDREYVMANMVGRYVVQVNAKFVDRVDDLDHQFYDASAILATYDTMTELRGPIVIVRQDDFNHGTSQPDLYQMLLRQTFDSQAAGQAWCDANALGRNDCYPRRDPVEPS